VHVPTSRASRQVWLEPPTVTGTRKISHSGLISVVAFGHAAATDAPSSRWRWRLPWRLTTFSPFVPKRENPMLQLQRAGAKILEFCGLDCALGAEFPAFDATKVWDRAARPSPPSRHPCRPLSDGLGQNRCRQKGMLTDTPPCLPAYCDLSGLRPSAWHAAVAEKINNSRIKQSI
jgi:hypothetical protein